MKQSSFTRFLRSLTALILALMLPFNALAATLVMPKALTNVEAQAFMNNTSIEDIVLPEGIKIIGAQAFAGCTALKKAVIPATVENIAADAFEGLQGQMTIETVKDSYAWNWGVEHGFIVVDPSMTFDVDFWHYSPTLFLGGNQPEIDVAEMSLIGELAEGESVEWNVEKVSGSDGANLYIGSVSEDGLRAYVFTGEVTAEGESVWRASAKFPDGSTWEKEFTTTVIPMPADMPTELDVDYPMYAELNKRFEFKPSERIHNLDAFPDVGNTIISHVAYYAEIWEDPTHEHIDDGYNGAFAFTPTKSERYGFTLYTYIGNHCVEHLGILVVGDGTSDRETIVEDLPEVIYLHGEGGSNWLGNVIVERYHLLPGEEVQWSIELIDSSNAVPAAEVYIGDLFENTRGANLYLGEVSGEPGTVTYLITAEVGGSVFTFEYVLAVNQEPENLPEGITVPQTYYEVEVGDSLTFLTDDIQLVNGEVPEGAQLRKEYWHVDMLEEQQELTWTEEGFAVKFVQDGRYQISAAALIGNILYELPIQIVVGSGMPADARMDTWQPVSTLYTGLEGNTHVFNADIQGYELFEGESYQWTLEQIGGDKLFDVYIDNEYDEWRGVNIHAEGCTDQTGSMTFRLTAASEGGLNLSTEFTIDVAELPEDLPTEIIIPSDLYELNVGDTLTLLFEDIRFGDGVIPDGNEVIRQYWGIEKLPGYEWLEDGESATFDTEGRYAVDAVIGVGNYRLIKRIGIVVGSGLENAELACEQILYTVYAEQEEHKHAFTAEVLGYDLFEGESYEWNLEVIDGSEEMLESYFGGEFDNWRGVAVMIGGYHGTGSVTYRLTVTSKGGLELSTDFTINVVELPEGLPTELVMDPSVFELNVGDSLTLSMDMFDFGEGVIPEDATIRTSFRDDWQLPNLNWLDEKSFTATFDANGRYQIWAVKEINNYTLLKPIMIIVGSGTPENVTFLYEQKVSKVYLEAGLEEHTAYFGVFDYPLLDGETYEWKLDLAEGDDLLGFRDYENEEGDHNDLYLCGATGETGSSVYRMTVTTNKGLSHEWLLPFEVEHLPENMPTALNVPEGGYRFNVGDVYDFDSNVLEVTDGVVPEDVAVRKEYWGIDQIPNGYWVEKENPQPGYFNEPTVYHVEFDREGRYSFNAAYRIGNYNVIAPVNVIVGDGFETEPEIKEEYFGSVQYANVNGGSWVGDVYLDNYPVLNGEELKWTMERIDDNECNPGEVIIDHQSDDGTWIGMHIHEFTGETGATTWKLTVESSTGFTLSKEYQIEFVEMPANLPTEIAVPEEIVYLNVGDTYVAKESDIGFANGVVPEGVDVAIQFGGYLGENNEVNWTEDGFEATFHQEGRYVYQVFAVINGYELCKDVFVIVGDYKPEGQIAEEAFFATQYVNMDGTNWVASLYLDGYEMLGGEWMDWKIERIDENAANPVRTIDYSADGTWVGVHVCDFTGETGTVTWRVTAQSSLGYSWSKEYDITFVEKPENLPTEITVPEEVVYLDVNETYAVSRNDIGFANGVVPEGVEPYVDLMAGHLQECGDFEWTEEGFAVTFHQDGRYVYSVSITINGFEMFKDVYLVVGNAVPADAWVEYWGTERTVYTNSEYQVWAFDAYVHNYERLPDEEFIWTLEQVSEGEPAVEVQRDEGDNWLGVWYNLLPTGEATGTVVYKLTLETSSGFTSSQEFTLHVVDRPDTLPTGIVVDQTEFQLAVDEVFTFTDEQVHLADGEVSDSDWTSIHFDRLWEGIEEQETFRWLEGDVHGFEVSFPQDGRYGFEVHYWINNILYVQPITITVGTGIPADARLVADVVMDTVFYGDGAAHDVYVGNVGVDGYRLLSGEEYAWTCEIIEAPEDHMPIELVLADEYDEGNGINMHATGINNGTGAVTWRVHFTTEGGLDLTTDITINVVDLPENVQAEIALPATEYQFEVGDEFELFNDEIQIVKCEGLEDYAFLKEYWLADHIPGCEGRETGIYFHFEEEGRYLVYAAVRWGNYFVEQPVTITVGDGIPGDATFVYHQKYTKFYSNIDNAVNHMAWFEINDYQLAEDEHFDWWLEHVSGSDLVDMHWDIVRDDGSEAWLYVDGFRGEQGVGTYRLNVATNHGLRYFVEFDVEVVDCPEGLPTEMFAPKTEFHFEIGDTYEFRNDVLELGEGYIPEGAKIIKEYWGFEGLPGAELIHETGDIEGDGWRVTFTENGRYQMYASIKIESYTLAVPMTVTVGTGVSDDAGLELAVGKEVTLYNVPEAVWVNDACLNNYTLLEGETVEWSLERVDTNGTDLGEVYVDFTFNDGLDAALRMRNITGETGTMIWNLTGKTSGGFAWSTDLVVNVVDGANRPTDATIANEEVHLEVGETYSVRLEDIGFNASVEGMTTFFEIYEDGLEGYHTFQWVDGGFDITFEENGRHQHHYSAIVGGIEFYKPVRIIVGSGEVEWAWLNVWHSQNPVYVGGDDTWNGNAYVENFPLFEGESIEWTLEQKNADEVPAAKLYIAENEYWDETLGMNYHVKDAAAVGETTYVVTAKLPSGQVLQEELTLYVQEMPENLPTELCVPQESYTLAVGERVTLRPYDIGFGEGDIPEDAAHHADIWPNGPYQAEWYDDNGETVDIWFEEPGVYNICFVRWIGNYVLYKDVPVTVVDASSENVIEVWVAEHVRDFTTAQIASFQAENADYADIAFIVNSVGESEAADAVLADAENSGDLFVFAQDQLARLVSAGRLEPVSADNMATIAAENDEGSVKAVQIGETAYAYPMTSDNGYFLYYDSSVVQDPSTLENVIAYCEDSGRTVCFEITSGWYQPAFFFGAGCTLTYGYDSEGNINSCDVNYASENGVRALKAMIGLAGSESFANTSIAGDTQNMGALVSGTWDANTVQQLLGDNYAAVKLPTVDGFQMSGFGGFKMLGITSQTNDHKKEACEALAMYLTSEKVQTERYEAVQWGPSNLKAQQNEAVQSNVALSALADQLQYCVPQGQYPDEYWNIAEKFGRRVLAGEFDGMSDAELMEVLTAFQQEVIALAQ